MICEYLWRGSQLKIKLSIIAHTSMELGIEREREREREREIDADTRQVGISSVLWTTLAVSYNPTSPWKARVYYEESVGIEKGPLLCSKTINQPYNAIFRHASYSRQVPEVRSVFQGSGYTPPGQRDLPRRSAALCAVTTPSPMNIVSPPLSQCGGATTFHAYRISCCTSSHPATRQRVPSPVTKATLYLPESVEDWKLADSFFQTTLVPEIMSLSSPEQMSSVLCEGIYSYFTSTYGTKTAATKRVKKRPPHRRALKEVERQKKDAKRELRLARKSGSPAEVVHSLATHLISLVLEHSKLKKASNARLLTREVKGARERCHRNFRQCAREILDGGLEPSFGDEAATSFFSEVYHSDPRNFVQPEWMLTPSPPEVEGWLGSSGG